MDLNELKLENPSVRSYLRDLNSKMPNLTLDLGWKVESLSNGLLGGWERLWIMLGMSWRMEKCKMNFRA